MRQNWDISCHEQVEKEVFNLRGRDVMRRLNQDIARVGNCKDLPRPNFRNEIWSHVRIGPGNQAERNSFLIEGFLKLLHCNTNLWAGILIQPRQYVGGASHGGYSVSDPGLGHSQRNGNIRRPVIDSWQNVGVEIDHER
jgi:hypothetical protein